MAMKLGKWPSDIAYVREMRDATGKVEIVKVELDDIEVSSVVQHLALQQDETAAALAHGYALRKAFAEASPGFSLHNAVRVS